MNTTSNECRYQWSLYSRKEVFKSTKATFRTSVSIAIDVYRNVNPCTLELILTRSNVFVLVLYY